MAWVIVVHDPHADGGDYAVGPFAVRDRADGYAEGIGLVTGSDGAAIVMELEDPDELTRAGMEDLGML
jgi:hypothetical protein